MNCLLCKARGCSQLRSSMVLLSSCTLQCPSFFKTLSSFQLQVFDISACRRDTHTVKSGTFQHVLTIVNLWEVKINTFPKNIRIGRGALLPCVQPRAILYFVFIEEYLSYFTFEFGDGKYEMSKWLKRINPVSGFPSRSICQCSDRTSDIVLAHDPPHALAIFLDLKIASHRPTQTLYALSCEFYMIVDPKVKSLFSWVVTGRCKHIYDISRIKTTVPEI